MKRLTNLAISKILNNPSMFPQNVLNTYPNDVRSVIKVSIIRSEFIFVCEIKQKFIKLLQKIIALSRVRNNLEEIDAFKFKFGFVRIMLILNNLSVRSNSSRIVNNLQLFMRVNKQNIENILQIMKTYIDDISTIQNMSRYPYGKRLIQNKNVKNLMNDYLEIYELLAKRIHKNMHTNRGIRQLNRLRSLRSWKS